MKDDAPRVIKIPAKPETTRQAEARRQLRVAAYCRVSTKEEDQANSYEVQKEYYTDKIMSNTAWTMAGIFADKGITGTSAKKREDFMRMIRLPPEENRCHPDQIGLPLLPQYGGLPLLYPGAQTTWHRSHLREGKHQFSGGGQ